MMISCDFNCPLVVKVDDCPDLRIAILSPCLFKLYAEYIMRNTGLEEAQAGIKIAGYSLIEITIRKVLKAV